MTHTTAQVVASTAPLTSRCCEGLQLTAHSGAHGRCCAGYVVWALGCGSLEKNAKVVPTLLAA